MNFIFGLKIGFKIKDWFFKLGGEIGLIGIVKGLLGKWCHIRATSFLHTLD